MDFVNNKFVLDSLRYWKRSFGREVYKKINKESYWNLHSYEYKTEHGQDVFLFSSSNLQFILPIFYSLFTFHPFLFFFHPLLPVHNVGELYHKCLESQDKLCDKW